MRPFSWISLSPLFCALTALNASAAPTLTVVATTDLHGALDAEVTETPNHEQVLSGGAWFAASYFKILRAAAQGPVLLVDAGDLFQGTLESNSNEGQAVIRYYRDIGMGAVAIGNHDFDFGPVGPDSVPRTPTDDPRGALQARMREANPRPGVGFPFLSANIVYANGLRPEWAVPSYVYPAGGFKVGIIGVTTPKTRSTTIRNNILDIDFKPVLPIVTEEALRLRVEENVNAVVVLFHGGGKCGNNSNPDDLSSCDSQSELFALANGLRPGLVDVIVGGDSHQQVAKRIGNIAVLQPGPKGKQFALAEVPLGGQDRVQVQGLIPICGTVVTTPRGDSCNAGDAKNATTPVHPAQFLGVPIAADAQVVRDLAPYFQQVTKIKNQLLGVEAKSSIARNYGGESALGNLITDMMRASIPGAHIGLTNGGGIRTDLDPGMITYGSIFEILPFDNRLALIGAKGSTVRKMVEVGITSGHGALIWSGLSVVARGCQIESITVNGQPLNDEGTYNIVTNDYLAAGGSGFDKVGLTPDQIKILWGNEYIMRDVVANGIANIGRPSISAVDFYDPQNPRQRISGQCHAGGR